MLYGKLLEVLSEQNFVMAFAGIAMPNDASVALHQSVGFEKIGTYPRVGFKDGAWRDTTWWCKSLSEPKSPPAALRSVSDVLGA